MMVLLQMIGEDVISTTDAQARELHAVKVERTPTQSAVLASLLTTYPPVFAGPKDGQSKEFPFASMKTFKEYSMRNGRDGLIFELKEGLAARAQSLMGIINTLLAYHEWAKMCCIALLGRVRTFYEWFLPQLATVYEEMVNNASGENAATSTMEADCWKVVTRTLKTFFKQIRKVRVHTESAILCGYANRSMGMFLNAALQELRLEEDLMKQGWCKHPLIQP